MDKKDRASIDDMEQRLGADPDAIEILPDGEVRYVDPEHRAASPPLPPRTRGIGGHY